MGKGNQIPEVVMSKTKLDDVDEFFAKAAEPMNQVITWNNNLDTMLQLFCSIGADIKNAHLEHPVPVVGVSEIRLTSDSLGVIVLVKKDGQEVAVKSLDKVTKEYVAMLETKAKLIQKRVTSLRKKPNLDHIKLKLEMSQLSLDIDKKWETEYNDDEVLLDLKRSVCKFNDRYSLLCEHLKGPITLHETIVALFEDVKKKLKELGTELGVTIDKDLVPKLTGVPESIQDVLPSLPARGWKLYRDLIDYIHQIQEQAPAIQEKLTSLANEAKDLQGKIKDSASACGLSLGDSFKVAKSFKKNTTSILETPKVLATLLRTVQTTLLSIGGALTGKADSAPAETASTPPKKATGTTDDSSDDDKDTTESTTTAKTDE
eukprot:c800_g1_i1.p1 GENE.c800_g1_i1~~c800_g1_i1.p1  ORF type:complete len:392 (+),score=118.15 c800_g1_i1:57-1178(+)